MRYPYILDRQFHDKSSVSFGLGFSYGDRYRFADMDPIDTEHQHHRRKIGIINSTTIILGTDFPSVVSLHLVGYMKPSMGTHKFATRIHLDPGIITPP